MQDCRRGADRFGVLEVKMREKSMDKDDKRLIGEMGDAWFKRNHERKELDIPMGCKLFEKAMKHWLKEMGAGSKILEIGCSYGYNLIYLCRKYQMEGYGIDPSGDAIAYGNEKIQREGGKIKIGFMQGTADRLPFENHTFNIVVLGFCMYCIDRKYVFRVVSEIDRVLKDGGMVAIWDFETPVPYMRPNIHHEDLWTYKDDVAKLFSGNPQYTLIEKRSFSDEREGFVSDIQERCALNILYKEQIKDIYKETL